MDLQEPVQGKTHTRFQFFNQFFHRGFSLDVVADEDISRELSKLLTFSWPGTRQPDDTEFVERFVFQKD